MECRDIFRANCVGYKTISVNKKNIVKVNFVVLSGLKLF